MKTTRLQKLLSLILCLALIAAMALMTVGCDESNTETPETEALTKAPVEAFTEEDDGGFGEIGTNTSSKDTVEGSTKAPPVVTEPAETASDVTVKGIGATVFYFNVIDKDGNVTKFEIHTDKTTVGDALLELELISGEEGAYGLYVKSVNGITADYNVDQTWWEFFVGEQSSMTGVDLTKVEAGATYAFKVSK